MDTQARGIRILRACCCVGLQERRLGECVNFPIAFAHMTIADH